MPWKRKTPGNLSPKAITAPAAATPLGISPGTRHLMELLHVAPVGLYQWGKPSCNIWNRNPKGQKSGTPPTSLIIFPTIQLRFLLKTLNVHPCFRKTGFSRPSYFDTWPTVGILAHNYGVVRQRAQMEGNLQGAEHCRAKSACDKFLHAAISQSTISGQWCDSTVNVMAAVWPHVAACAASLDEVSSAVYPYFIRFIACTPAEYQNAALTWPNANTKLWAGCIWAAGLTRMGHICAWVLDWICFISSASSYLYTTQLNPQGVGFPLVLMHKALPWHVTTDWDVLANLDSFKAKKKYNGMFAGWVLKQK